MPEYTAYINIGSNMGDRYGNISRAVALIMERVGADPNVSEPVESEPWGYESDQTFINVGLTLQSSLEPHALLKILQSVEHEISPAPHRDASGAYIDRMIDIDLIACGQAVIDTPALTLPHPAMHLRRFVLIPMIELMPHWQHPQLGLTPSQMLARIQD